MSDKSAPLDHTPVRSRELTDCRVFRVRADHYVDSNTNVGADYYVIDSDDWVNVIALTSDRSVVLIEQFRHGIRRVTLEIPGGMVEPGEDPQAAGLRELMEETGYGGGEARLLGYVEPNPAIQNNRCWIVCVDGVELIGPQRLDDAEDITVRLEPLTRIPELIKEGRITHALVVAAFHRLHLAAENKVPSIRAMPNTAV